MLRLVMGLTGAVTVVARLTSRPIVQGLILGLGLALLLLLAFGATVALVREPVLLGVMSSGWRW
jgi:hypothetical protein